VRFGGLVLRLHAPAHMRWLRDHGLTLVLLGLFVLFLIGQILTGWYELNATARDHGQVAITLTEYFGTGHLWEATFENWESEFLQMAVFVTFTTWLHQKGSSESRRPDVVELVDADPRDFAHLPDAPWPVRRGGWILRIYERSLGLALICLFAVSLIGHAVGGWIAARAEETAHGHAGPAFVEYVASSRFWFESFQNWQSEFLAIAAMVWLAIYLRHRGSPESKPVHAPHSDTGR
jgi:hypothetical protein